MTKIWQFPTFPISGQLFRVPGGYIEGGYTRGGAKTGSPEPAGFSFLDIQPAIQINEWDFPISSWLASKGNGEVLRVRLAPTPQIAFSRRRANANAGVTWDTDLLWSNMALWEGDFSLQFATNILEGSTEAVIDCSSLGQVFQMGHVFGHGNYTYLIDEIEYDSNDFASVMFRSPSRQDISVGDTCYTRPWFLGRIANPDAIPKLYDASGNGTIQLNQITLSEAII